MEDGIGRFAGRLLYVSAFVVSHIIILPLITEEDCGAFPGDLFICVRTRGVFLKIYACLKLYDLLLSF